jgi:hypothetical protein
MSRTIITKFAVLTVLALMALISVQGAVAKTQPQVDAAVLAALAKIQHPGSVSGMTGYESFRGGPTGVYEGGIEIPAELSYIQHPGTVTG